MSVAAAHHSNHVHVVETIPALPGQDERLKVELSRLVPICRTEKGCVYYKLFQDCVRSSVFTVLMGWERQVDYEAHNKAPHIIAFAERFKDVLYKDEQITEATLVQLV